MFRTSVKVSDLPPTFSLIYSLPICLSVRLSVCLSVCLSVSLSLSFSLSFSLPLWQKIHRNSPEARVVRDTQTRTLHLRRMGLWRIAQVGYKAHAALWQSAWSRDFLRVYLIPASFFKAGCWRIPKWRFAPLSNLFWTQWNTISRPYCHSSMIYRYTIHCTWLCCLAVLLLSWPDPEQWEVR